MCRSIMEGGRGPPGPGVGSASSSRMIAERRKSDASKTSRSKAFFRWRRTKKTIKKESRAIPAMPPAILPTMAPALMPEEGTGAEDAVELAGSVREAVTVRVLLLRWVVVGTTVEDTDEVDDGGGIAVTIGMLLVLLVRVVTGGGGGRTDVVVGGIGSGMGVVVVGWLGLGLGCFGGFGISSGGGMAGPGRIDVIVGGSSITGGLSFCRARRFLR
jgi:hypothetical protein